MGEMADDLVDGKEVKDKLIKLRDDSVSGSLCSDFVVQVLSVMIDQLGDSNNVG